MQAWKPLRLLWFIAFSASAWACQTPLPPNLVFCKTSQDCGLGQLCTQGICRLGSEKDTESPNELPADTIEEGRAEGVAETESHVESPKDNEPPRESQTEAASETPDASEKKHEALLERPPDREPHRESPEAASEALTEGASETPVPSETQEASPDPLERQPEPRPENAPEFPPECPLSACPICDPTTACPQGLACQQGRCPAFCQTDSDCKTNFVCSERLCYAPVASLSATSPFQWVDGTAASDCLEYRYGKSPRVGTYGYQGSSLSGVYLIQPAGVAAPFPVYCDMATEGGGWTLVLKADGSKPTFAYNAALWGDPTKGPGTDPDLNTTEALLPSYASLPHSQILLVFRDDQNQDRSLIADLDGPSLFSLIKEASYQPFQRPLSYLSWLSLVEQPSLHSFCRLGGLNVLGTYSTSNPLGVRIGFLTSPQGQCNYEGRSFVGIGGRDSANNKPPGGITNAGNYAHPDAPDGSRNSKLWGYVFVRDLRNLRPVRLSQGVTTFLDGFVPPDCLHLHLLWLSPQPLPAVGTFSIWPPATLRPFPAACQTSTRDGGWTLVLKADGSRSTFASKAPFWDAKDEINRRYRTDKPHLDTEEALLPSYSLLPTHQILAQIKPLPHQSPLKPADFADAILPLRASSLAEPLMKTSATPLTPPLPRSEWLSLLAGSSLQTNPSCDNQGFNLEAPSSNGLLSGLRIGIMADDAADCKTPDSFFGFGPSFASPPTLPSPPTVGGFVRLSSGQDAATPAFGMLSIRDLSGAAASSSSSDILLVDIQGVSARQRRSGHFEPSCRAYRHPPLYKGPDARSGLFRIHPLGSAAPFVVFCDMDTGGGGWTLLLKADGSKDTFAYDKPLWKNATPYEPTKPDLDRQEAKLESFSTVPFSEILLKMLPATEMDLSKATSIRAEIRASSFFEIVKNGTLVPFERNPGRAAWKALLPQTSLQTRYSLEGLNLPMFGSNPHLRIGIAANGEAHPDNPDSFIGIGYKYSPYTGNFSYSDGDNGGKNVSSFGFLLVR